MLNIDIKNIALLISLRFEDLGKFINSFRHAPTGRPNSLEFLIFKFKFLKLIFSSLQVKIVFK